MNRNFSNCESAMVLVELLVAVVILTASIALLTASQQTALRQIKKASLEVNKTIAAKSAMALHQNSDQILAAREVFSVPSSSIIGAMSCPN